MFWSLKYYVSRVTTRVLTHFSTIFRHRVVEGGGASIARGIRVFFPRFSRFSRFFHGFAVFFHGFAVYYRISRIICFCNLELII